MPKAANAYDKVDKDQLKLRQEAMEHQEHIESHSEELVNDPKMIDDNLKIMQKRQTRAKVASDSTADSNNLRTLSVYAKDASTKLATAKPVDFKKTMEMLRGKLGDDHGVIHYSRYGRNVATFFRTPPSFSFMRGSLEVEIKEKIRKNAVRMKREELAEVTAGKRIQQTADFEFQQQLRTGEIRKLLKKRVGRAGREVPFLNFVSHPKSYAQTMENYFDVALLAASHKVRVSVNRDGTYILNPEHVRENVQPHQFVLSMNLRDFPDYAESLGMEKSQLPDRSELYERAALEAEKEKSKNRAKRRRAMSDSEDETEAEESDVGGAHEAEIEEDME
eukprot:TRINITY_DN44783_c0_g1_i1.p1 TRINITY_DN44783_c0_g1~~TRINITY_DN44783_c0_g1_i1.p1  ORF type:complete len:334 (+),score=104.30 TRINITY_DN44783_c0_g1_i1:49-1050(+)